MTLSRVLFVLIVVLIICVVVFILKKARKDKRILSVSNALTVLTGVLLVILLFLVPYAFPSATENTDVKIIDWSGDRSVNTPIMTMTSCKDELHTSNITSKKPAYFVMLSTRFIFTFANYGNMGMYQME
jgi:hypothetical protein